MDMRKNIEKSMETNFEISVKESTEQTEYEQSAWLLTVNDPWAKLGRTYEYSYAKVCRPESRLIVAKEGEKVIGCLLLEPESTLKAFVRALCVAEEYRSKGVGGKLLTYAEQRAFALTDNVFLFVSTERVKKYYERNGYKEVGFLEDFNAVGVHEWIMRKQR